MRGAELSVYGQVRRGIGILRLRVYSRSGRSSRVKHCKVLAGVVHDEAAGISKEVGAAVSTNAAGITPLGSRLPGPPSLVFEDAIEPPAVQQTCISL